MKAFMYISVIAFTLITLFSYTSLQAANQATGLVSEIVEITKKIRIQNNSDEEKGEESSHNDSKYGEMFVLDSTSMRYELIGQTMIVDVTGNTLTPDELKTPCTAKIGYQKLGSGYCNAQKIEVKNCTSNASNAWFEPSGD